MKTTQMFTYLLTSLIIGVLAAGAIANPASPFDPANLQPLTLDVLKVNTDTKLGMASKALSPGDPVDFDAAQIAGADYLQQMQADITDDNAGNGTDGVDETPDDPDDGGWDWVRTSPPDPFFHSTSASPVNIFGATAMGLYYTYLETSNAAYFTALADAANGMLANSSIRSARDLVFLMLYNDLSGVTGTAYKDTARARYDARIATYGSATAFAEYIRDVRGASYPNGIIAWDIGPWARAAAMLDARYSGNGYDVDADDMAEVVWQDSFNDNPGFFDIEDDKGSDPGYADVNFYWYNLGITGLIEAFSTSGNHAAEIPALVTRLFESQYSGGAISYQYGATTDDEDWQSTAYAALILADIDQATYQTELNHMGYWIGATQDVSGGWKYSDDSHYPEIGGENLAALFFTDNTLTDAVVDDDFASQADVDAYNTANSTSYVFGYDAFATIQEAIDAVNGASNTITVAAGTYAEGPQIQIDKNIAIQGSTAKSVVTITPTANTGSSGDARGWFLVDASTTFDLSNVTLDGAGFLIYQCIRNKGGGTYTNVTFQNILYNESGPTYSGVGIAAFGDLNVTLDQCVFSNVGRIGALLFGTGLTNSFFTNNVYTGKGDGDWLDYAADISAGAVVTVTGNTITNCTGVASSDGSTSAGLLVSTYFGAGTTANLEGNTISGCTAGLNVGYDGSDASTVTVTNGNEFLDNDYGIVTSSSASISLTVYGNSFFNTVNADDNAGGTWDNGSIGNCWSDFSSNAGYPTNYVVGGTPGAVDNYPSVDCGLDMTPDAITYLCAGTFTFDVDLGGAIQDLDGANIGYSYPAELTLVGVTAASANYTLFYNVNDNVTGLDTLYVQLGVLTGSQDGPATLYTVELSGTTDYCTPALVSMVSADLRDSNNNPITFSLASPSTVQADCADPDFTLNNPPGGGIYNVAPVLDFSVTDNCAIDAIYYQIDNCAGGPWTAIATGVSATAYNDAAWTLPDFGSLSETSHCIYFLVIDESGRGNSDSCSFSWCFTKDVTAPPAPTNLVASPGHNKVKLSWTNATSDFDHTVIMRTDWYAGGHGYPRYGQLNPEGPYSQDTTDGDLIISTTGVAHVDTDDLSNATRDVYHYAAFTVDAAGNVSAPGSTEARSTSYWLGDVADPTTTLGAFDGYVYFGDLYQFSLTYAKAVTDPGFIYDANFGPTHNNSAIGIPLPDDSVQFEDLIIFAINYDAVNPTMKAVPLLPKHDVLGPLAMELQAGVNDGVTHYELAIRNNAGDLKGLHAVIDIGAATLKSIRVNDAFEDAANPVFVDYREVDGRVILDLAILGTGRTIAGSGVVATIELDGTSSGHSSPVLIEGVMRDAENKELSVTLHSSSPLSLPTTYELLQNYPNPFNPSTEIAFDLPRQSYVTLEIYSIVGQRVAVLVDQPMEAGHQTVTWDGTNSGGQRVASGVYLYRLTADSFVESRKMILVK